jgi:hypothetical protein
VKHVFKDHLFCHQNIIIQDRCFLKRGLLYIVNMKRLMLSPKTDWSLQGIPWSLLGEVQDRLVSPGNSLVSPRRGSKQAGLSREFPGLS